jgi:hypothetical protein
MLKKNLLSLSLALLICVTPIHAKTHKKKSSSKSALPSVLVVDDFENKALNKWWAFGDLTPSIVQNKPNEFAGVGNFSMQLRGTSIGGIGTALNIPGNKYTMLKMAVRGNGAESGTLSLQLYVADPKTGQIKEDPRNPGYLLAGSKYVYTQRITWNGWKTVIIPMDRFRRESGKRNDEGRIGGSEKWVQFQIICAPEDRKNFLIALDNIRFF